MTRELLLPVLAIVILVNVGVITYVIGHRGAREHEPPWRHSEVRRSEPSEVRRAAPRRTGRLSTAGGAPAPSSLPSPERTPAPGGEAGPRPSR